MELVCRVQVDSMKAPSTSKEEIMKQVRTLLRNGRELNVRELADACGVSVGCIYNYYPSKTALTVAAVEDVWNEILEMDGMEYEGLESCVARLVDRFHYAQQSYPGFFERHALSFEAGETQAGRERMQKTMECLRERIAVAIHVDPEVRMDMFDEEFTEGDLAQHILSQLIGLALVRGLDTEAALKFVRRVVLSS